MAPPEKDKKKSAALPGIKISDQTGGAVASDAAKTASAVEKKNVDEKGKGISVGSTGGRLKRMARKSVKPVAATSFSPPGSSPAGKRQRVSSPARPRFDSASLGGKFAYTVRAAEEWTPHVLTVSPGEDIMAIIHQFAQAGPYGICILSAAGRVSDVHLSRCDSTIGFISLEGDYKIVTLTGTYILSESGDMLDNIPANITVELADNKDQLITGTVSGVLTAREPVQVVFASFAPINPKQSEEPQYLPPVLRQRDPSGKGKGKMHEEDDPCGKGKGKMRDPLESDSSSDMSDSSSDM